MSVKLFSQDNLTFFTHCSTHFTFIFSLQVVITRVNTWSTWLCFSSDLVIFVSVSRNLNSFSFFRKKKQTKKPKKNRPKKQQNKIIIKKKRKKKKKEGTSSNKRFSKILHLSFNKFITWTVQFSQSYNKFLDSNGS